MNNTFIRNQICTLEFYLNRCDDIKAERVYVYIDNLLFSIVKSIQSGNNDYTYLHTLFKMLFQSRDCLRGKGEKMTSYVFICAFHKYFPQHAMYALHSFCCYHGCWADIKYFCRFVKDFQYLNEHDRNSLIYKAIDITIYQFDMDYTSWSHAFNTYLNVKGSGVDIERPYAPDMISMVSKWIPRESSAFQWLFDKIVERYYYIHYPYLFNDSFDTKKWNKMKMDFRKKVVSLSKEFNISQKYMCSKQYDQLTSKNVTLQTAIRQSKYLCEDAASPMNTFCDYIDKEYEYIHSHGKKNMNVSLDILVKKGFKLIESRYDNNTEYQIRMLNNIWTKIVKNMNFSLSVIPICDLSGPQKYAALGMGILMAQISTYKKVIIVENQFRVVEIDENDTFVDILRTFFDYKCLYFNISFMFSCLYKQHNACYVDPMRYVILSSENNILKNQYDICNHYDKNVCIIFWNVLSDGDSIQPLLLDRYLYFSGITPNLLHVLNNENIYKSTNDKDCDKNYDILYESLNNYAFTHHYSFPIPLC